MRTRELQAPTGIGGGRIVAMLVGLILAVSALLAASPAHAHDELLSTDPAADSTVDAAPAAVTMTFSGTLLSDPGATEVQVTDASGASVADGAPEVIDNVVTQALVPAAGGPITVLWRVVSSDGHPISGEFAFTVAGAPATPTGTPDPSPTIEPSPPAETSTPAATASAAPSAIPSPEPAASTDAGSPAPWIVGGLIALLAVGGVIAYLIARRRRDGDADGRGAATGPASGDVRSDR